LQDEGSPHRPGIYSKLQRKFPVPERLRRGPPVDPVRAGGKCAGPGIGNPVVDEYHLGRRGFIRVTGPDTVGSKLGASDKRDQGRKQSEHADKRALRVIVH
jgi:hypothetical protein